MNKNYNKKQLKRIFSSSSLLTSNNNLCNNSSLSPNDSLINLSKPFNTKNSGLLSLSSSKRTKLSLFQLHEKHFSPRKVSTIQITPLMRRYNNLKSYHHKDERSTSTGCTISSKNESKKNNPQFLSKIGHFKYYSQGLDFHKISQSSRNKIFQLRIKNLQNNKSENNINGLPKIEQKNTSQEDILPSKEKRAIRDRKEKFLNKFLQSEKYERYNSARDELKKRTLLFMKKNKEKATRINKENIFISQQISKIQTALSNYKDFFITNTTTRDIHILEIIICSKLRTYLFYFFYRFPYSLEFDFSQISYLSFKYFDCYNELLQIADPRNPCDNYKNIFQKIVEEMERKKEQREKKIFDIINQGYIDKLIQFENNNEYHLEENGKNPLGLPNKEIKIIKKETSIYGKKEIDRKSTTAIKHIFTNKKVINFNPFKNKRNCNRGYTTNIIYGNTLLKKLLKSKNRKLSKELSSQYSCNSILNYLFLSLKKNKVNNFIKVFEKYKCKININQTDSDSNTMLIIATKNYFYQICKWLLNEGADPNIQNNYNNTALHYAVSFKYYPIVNLLVQYKADETIKNSLGLTPWECSNINCEG